MKPNKPDHDTADFIKAWFGCFAIAAAFIIAMLLRHFINH